MIRIPRAPASFDGTLGELYRDRIASVLIAPESVEAFHSMLIRYLDSEDPVFPIRGVTGMERRETRRTAASWSWMRHASLSQSGTLR